MKAQTLKHLAWCIGPHRSSEIDVDEQLELVAELKAAAERRGAPPARDSAGITRRHEVANA